MFLYGNSPKSTINIIKSSYHKAARAAVYAHRTAPIDNILNEAGLPSVENRILEVKGRILTKLLTSTNSIIDSDVSSHISAKKTKRIKSAIALSLELASAMDMPIKVIKKNIEKPPWKFNNTYVDLSLSELKKLNTTKEQFLCIFAKEKMELKKNGWCFLYTDGSKCDDSLPAYAVVDDEGNNVALSTMYQLSSIFTTEACAILCAIQHAAVIKAKTIIFTDSLSVLKSVQNPFNNKWNKVVKIRDALINNEGKIRLYWVPSHIGIIGNEKADKAARYASYAPILLDDTVEKTDLRRQITSYINMKIKTSQTQRPYYININPNFIQPVYPTNLNKKKIKTFSRLRIGHSVFSHDYILKKNSSPKCTNCNCKLTVNHLLNECPSLHNQRLKHFNNASAFTILQNPSTTNINTIYNFIREINVLV